MNLIAVLLRLLPNMDSLQRFFLRPISSFPNFQCYFLYFIQNIDLKGNLYRFPKENQKNMSPEIKGFKDIETVKNNHAKIH